MNRNHYKVFSEGNIAGLTISNRLVRSATWDPSILTARQWIGENGGNGPPSAARLQGYCPA
jgi:hypothetical protein